MSSSHDKEIHVSLKFQMNETFAECLHSFWKHLYMYIDKYTYMYINKMINIDK